MGTTHVFAGDDRRLCGMAWAAGDFPAIVYRDDAAKLSPVLEGPDLADFLGALLDVAGEMAVRDVLTAMNGRYGLDPPILDAEATPADEQARPEVELVRRELADGVLAELTDRQLRVLVALHQERSVRDLADQLDCSVGTISSETNAIRKALNPLGRDAGPVLNEVLDRAFRTNV
jgi:DNA-binding CsgD family transcriptional regulator